mgnify:CR=1 FL=1
MRATDGVNVGIASSFSPLLLLLGLLLGLLD